LAAEIIRVLIVDDDEADTELARAMLADTERMKFAVTCAATYEAAGMENVIGKTASPPTNLGRFSTRFSPPR